MEFSGFFCITFDRRCLKFEYHCSVPNILELFYSMRSMESDVGREEVLVVILCVVGDHEPVAEERRGLAGHDRHSAAIVLRHISEAIVPLLKHK